MRSGKTKNLSVDQLVNAGVAADRLVRRAAVIAKRRATSSWMRRPQPFCPVWRPMSRQSGRWSGRASIAGRRAVVRQVLKKPPLAACRLNAVLKSK
uniref:Uncharacterized protein n=1 Tax=Agrobacterium fabrum TaxID=1176649 RepID=A0A2Z2PHV5_9HYPH|nr:hypothetical protein [Agrobacterium fabrum]